MCHHTHLTLSEREDIMIMRREGRKITEIAEAIGRSRSPVFDRVFFCETQCALMVENGA